MAGFGGGGIGFSLLSAGAQRAERIPPKAVEAARLRLLISIDRSIFEQ
jgi:hypothetical protein